jgi:Xaa-Pro aminopeptidase
VNPLGHSISLDGHEHPSLVYGSSTALESDMIFTNEPGIHFPGEFGIRGEDDMVITCDAPAQLLATGFQPSLGKPLS